MLSLRCMPPCHHHAELRLPFTFKSYKPRCSEHSRGVFCGYSVSGYTIKQAFLSGRPSFHPDHPWVDIQAPTHSIGSSRSRPVLLSMYRGVIFLQLISVSGVKRPDSLSCGEPSCPQCAGPPAVPGIQELHICLLPDVPILPAG